MRRLLVLPTAAAVLVTALAPAALAADTAVVHRESVLTELDAAGTPGTSRIFTQLTVPFGERVSLPGQSTSSLRSLTGDSSVDGDAVVFGGGLSRTVADHTADLPVSIEVSYAIDGETVDPEDVVGHDGEVAVTYVVRNLTAEPTDLTVVDGDRVASTQTVDVAVPLVGSLSMTLPPAFEDVTAPGAVVVGDGRGNTVVNWSLLLFAPIGAETQEVTWTANARDAIVPEAVLQVIPVSPASFGSFESTTEAYSGAVGSTRELTSGAREIDRNLKLLAEGSAKLLAGLVQLRDGSGQLADGLVAARDGSGELADGLGSARDGSRRLSDGLGAARDGAGQLSDGLGDLSDGSVRIADGLAALDAGGTALIDGLGQLAGGSGELAAGVGQLADGAQLLDDNAKQLAAGANQLSGGAASLQDGINELAAGLTGSEGLPAALVGIDQLQAGIGDSTKPNTLLNGLALLGAGLVKAQNGIGTPATKDTLRNGVARVGGGLNNPACDPTNPANPANPCGVTQLNSSIGALSGAMVTDLSAAIGTLTAIDETTLVPADQTRLADTITSLQTNAVRAGTIQATSAGITTVVTQLQGGLGLVDAGLVDLSDGIGDAATADTLRNGVFRLTAGVSNPACNPANPSNPANPCGLLEGLTILEDKLAAAATDISAGLGSASTPNTLLWGAAQVAGGSAAVSDGAGRLQAEGTAALAAGAAKAAAGAEQLAAGAARADAGGQQLGDGAGQLADGSVALRDGAAKAAAGSGDLLDGLVQLDEGGEQLADGLVDAADGSQRLADGLVDAADGSQQIAGGLTRAVPGGEQIAGGAQRLTDEGTSVLARSVSDASLSADVSLAHLQAVADRGSRGDGLPYPTVDGAMASAVYEFQLAGVDTEPGAGAAGRIGMGALALAAAALLGSMAGGRTGGRRPEIDEEFVDLREPVRV